MHASQVVLFTRSVDEITSLSDVAGLACAKPKMSNTF
jgi:hypothetical protein